MKFVDYYEVLQVNPSADFEIIKVAYRQLSKKHHPDTSTGENKKFLLIKEAYDILSDIHKRKEYDEFRRINLQSDNSENRIEKVEKNINGYSNYKSRYNKLFLENNTWIVIAISTLTIVVLLFIFTVGDIENDLAYIFGGDATSEIDNFSLPIEEYSKIKTTDHILDYGEAYFDIYNGTNLTITSITIEINVLNEQGNIIDTRQFQKDVYIDPLSVQSDIHITTGIEGLPPLSEHDSRVQSKYISWSYTNIIAFDYN